MRCPRDLSISSLPVRLSYDNRFNQRKDAMLSISTYPKEQIDRTRVRIEAQVSTYTKLAPKGEEALEAAFFNNMVLALDHHFLHRARATEGKDGNPLNEVRVLCDSLTDNDGTMAPNKTIKVKGAESVLGYEEGEEIKLDAAGFCRLADGFFGELESRYA